MEAGAPYAVVAQSGKFCLGFPDENEVATQNPYGRATTNKRLRLGGDYFDCPGIHFVSGMVDTPDGDHLWIAYGVNDCSPQLYSLLICGAARRRKRRFHPNQLLCCTSRLVAETWFGLDECTALVSRGVSNLSSTNRERVKCEAVCSVLLGKAQF
eukprot:scaffold75_cov165-Amphora_coffeaeformis.AAC.27